MNTLTMNNSRPSGLGATLRRTGQTLLRVLEANGQDRAQRHLLDYARQCESLQPDLAKELRAASRAMR